MGKLRTEGQKSLQYQRQKAVNEAWKEEVELVREGKGTRQWSVEEQKELLANGKVSGYYGHHMQSVKTNPENASNKDNIQFLNYDEHIDGAHQGNTKNSTNGYYDPATGQMNEFKDGNLVPITPMNQEQQAFDTIEERDNAYKQGMVDRYNNNLDKKLADYQKNLEQREELSDEQKNEKYEQRAAKYEADKEEFYTSMFSEQSIEKSENNDIANNMQSNSSLGEVDSKVASEKDIGIHSIENESVDSDNSNGIETVSNTEESDSSLSDATNDNTSSSESSSGNDGGIDY